MNFPIKVEKIRLQKIERGIEELVSSPDLKYIRSLIEKYDDIEFSDLCRRDIIRRILKHASLCKKRGKAIYLILDSELDDRGVRELSVEILRECRSYLSRRDVGFLASINEDESRFFSAKQILYLEGLCEYSRKTVGPHKQRKTFNPKVYRELPKQRLAIRLLNFATSGKLIETAVPENCLRVIREKWFSEEAGLYPLTRALSAYIEKRRLRFFPSNYEPIINELERYFKANTSQPATH